MWFSQKTAIFFLNSFNLLIFVIPRQCALFCIQWSFIWNLEPARSAGSYRWYGSLSYVKLKLKLIYGRQSVGQSVLVSGTHLGPVTNFFLLEISFRHFQVCYFVAPSLTRGRVCNLLYNCFSALPEQSLLRWSPAELTAIFYSLIWDSPNMEGQVPVFKCPSNRVAQWHYIKFRTCKFISVPWEPFMCASKESLRSTVYEILSLKSRDITWCVVLQSALPDSSHV
jgi:hypothetical protein